VESTTRDELGDGDVICPRVSDVEEGCPHHPTDLIASSLCRQRGLCAPRGQHKAAGSIGARSRRKRDVVMPQEFTWPVIARAIEKAEGAYLDHEDLRRAVSADPDLAARAEAAAASSEYSWQSADLFLGNAVAHWSRAWTVGNNQYAAQFERVGTKERDYRYRLRSGDQSR